MAYIRISTKLSSGISGWYIYYDVNGRMFIESPREFANMFHTLEDVITIRDILNECIGDMNLKESDPKHHYHRVCLHCAKDFITHRETQRLCNDHRIVNGLMKCLMNGWVFRYLGMRR